MPFVSSVRGSFGLQKRPFPNLNINSSNSSITGGTITTAGGYRIHTYTSAGTSSFDYTYSGGSVNGAIVSFPVEYLIIGGGGGGAQEIGGAGGAGGYLTGSINVSSSVNSVVVGAGGAQRPQASHGDSPSNQGFDGENSSALGLTAFKGGRGGSYEGANRQGGGNGAANSPGSYGSGGGAGGHQGGGGGGAGSAGTNGSGGPNLQPGGTGTSGQGYPGGVGVQGDHNPSAVGGAGGSGLSSSITGSAVTRAAGGGGGIYQGVGGAAGSGGGGAGANRDAQSGSRNGQPGQSVGSGGGGGGYSPNGHGGGGVAGMVVIRYPV